MHYRRTARTPDAYVACRGLAQVLRVFRFLPRHGRGGPRRRPRRDAAGPCWLPPYLRCTCGSCYCGVLPGLMVLVAGVAVPLEHLWISFCYAYFVVYQMLLELVASVAHLWSNCLGVLRGLPVAAGVGHWLLRALEHLRSFSGRTCCPVSGGCRSAALDAAGMVSAPLASASVVRSRCSAPVP